MRTLHVAPVSAIDIAAEYTLVKASGIQLGQSPYATNYCYVSTAATPRAFAAGARLDLEPATRW